MAKTVFRFNTFETNSSGTHCYCWMDQQELDAFLRGEFYVRAEDDWDEASKLTPDEFEQEREEYKENQRRYYETVTEKSPYAWYLVHDDDELDVLFPLYQETADGTLMEEADPCYGEYRHWRHNVKLPNEDYYEGSIRMSIEEPPGTDDPNEKMKVEFEFYEG